jgi:hypothetical protein
MVRPPVLARLLGVTVALLLSQCRPCGAVLDCIGFEAYSQCGEPEEAFRHEQGDVPCEEATELAGYCVCESEGCTDEANAIRVEIDCVGKGAELAELDSARNCSTVCSKHSSNMWIAGIAASVGASCSTAVGLIVQKSAQLKNQALPTDKRPPEFFGFIMAPLWIMGFLLLVLVPLPFNLMAVTWAAASLIAPLAAVTLVINQVLAPFTLDESLSRVDVVATVIIVAGVVLATAFGTHCESSYTPDDLIELYAEPPFLICAATLLVCLVTSYVTIRRWRRTLPAKLDTEAMAALGGQAPERVGGRFPTQPVLHASYFDWDSPILARAPATRVRPKRLGQVCVAYAFLAGATGALMQIVFKGIGELVGAAAFDHWALWVFIPLMVILATCQMSFLNKVRRARCLCLEGCESPEPGQMKQPRELAGDGGLQRGEVLPNVQRLADCHDDTDGHAVLRGVQGPRWAHRLGVLHGRRSAGDTWSPPAHQTLHGGRTPGGSTGEKRG